MSVSTGTVEVLLPKLVSQGTATRLSERPASLAGTTVGIVWNSKPNGDALFEEFVARTSETQRIAEVRYYRKPNAANGADPELLRQVVEECDAALVALGD